MELVACYRCCDIICTPILDYEDKTCEGEVQNGFSHILPNMFPSFNPRKIVPAHSHCLDWRNATYLVLLFLGLGSLLNFTPLHKCSAYHEECPN